MPRQEYHFDKSGKLVKGSPPLKGAKHDPLIKTAKAALKKARPTHGELKFANDKEYAKYCVKRSMVEKNITMKDLLKNAKTMHYFPKSQAEYLAMAKFEGRGVK